MLAPTATPAAIIDRLNAALANVLELLEVKEQFLRQGVYALPGTTPAKASERLRTEGSRGAKVITDARIKADE